MELWQMLDRTRIEIVDQAPNGHLVAVILEQESHGDLIPGVRFDCGISLAEYGIEKLTDKERQNLHL